MPCSSSEAGPCSRLHWQLLLLLLWPCSLPALCAQAVLRCAKSQAWHELLMLGSKWHRELRYCAEHFMARQR